MGGKLGLGRGKGGGGMMRGWLLDLASCRLAPARRRAGSGEVVVFGARRKAELDVITAELLVSGTGCVDGAG